MIEIKNMNLHNVGVGISLPKGTDIDLKMDQVTVIGGGAFLEERDEPNLVESLGLPPDTPAEFVLEVVRELRGNPHLQGQEKIESLKNSNLWSFIERSSNVTTVIQGVLALTAFSYDNFSSRYAYEAGRLFGWRGGQVDQERRHRCHSSKSWRSPST